MKLNQSKKIKIIFIETSKLEYSHLYDQVDWIYIATPISTHFDLVKKFLKLKKNILCEKPISLDKNEINYLYKLAKKSKAILFVNHIEYFKFIQNNFFFNKNNSIKNHTNSFYNFETKFNKYLYHDFYLLEGKIDLRNMKVNSFSEDSDIVIIENNNIHKISSKVISSAKRIHSINNQSFITKKDYILDYFLSIFNGLENDSLNKKQVFFVSRFYEILRKNIKIKKVIKLNDLNN